mmetsp:Transcript_24717/g.58360  ORF Transcript_24717/g.58360 Transcript_24717/m.58360 type:complete len:213 (-) Transcript_24717:124-762(-)
MVQRRLERCGEGAARADGGGVGAGRSRRRHVGRVTGRRSLPRRLASERDLDDLVLVMARAMDAEGDGGAGGTLDELSHLVHVRTRDRPSVNLTHDVPDAQLARSGGSTTRGETAHHEDTAGLGHQEHPDTARLGLGAAGCCEATLVAGTGAITRVGIHRVPARSVDRVATVHVIVVVRSTCVVSVVVRAARAIHRGAGALRVDAGVLTCDGR